MKRRTFVKVASRVIVIYSCIGWSSATAKTRLPDVLGVPLGSAVQSLKRCDQNKEVSPGALCWEPSTVKDKLILKGIRGLEGLTVHGYVIAGRLEKFEFDFKGDGEREQVEVVLRRSLRNPSSQGVNTAVAPTDVRFRRFWYRTGWKAVCLTYGPNSEHGSFGAWTDEWERHSIGGMHG